MTQPTVSKHWRRVVSHPDRPQSNQALLTMLQYYNMHADIIQENNLTQSNLSTVSELSEMKPNLLDRWKAVRFRTFPDQQCSALQRSSSGRWWNVTEERRTNQRPRSLAAAYRRRTADPTHARRTQINVTANTIPVFSTQQNKISSELPPSWMISRSSQHCPFSTSANSWFNVGWYGLKVN